MIYFEKLRYKNLLSSGNMFLEIDLKETSTTLIIGDNGTGKSTMLDALCYVLFGKAFRKVNTPLLINSINEKEMLVEVEFVIGKKHYLVRRGLKPRILEIYIDGKILDQDSTIKDYQKILETNILKLNFKSFTQVVILGSSNFVPFMQLNPSDRRIIIEDLLDIQIFSSMNTLLKEKQSTLKENLKDISNQLKLLDEKLVIHKSHLNTLTIKNKEAIEENKENLSMKQAVVLECDIEIIDIQRKIKGLLDTIKDKDVISNKINKLNEFKSKIETKIKRFDKDIKFFTDNKDCPKCLQPLTKEYTGDILKDTWTNCDRLKIGQTQLVRELQNVNDRLSNINSILTTVMDYETTIQDYNSKIKVANGIISRIQQDILNKSCNDDGSDIKKEVTDLEGQRIDVNSKEKTLNDDRIHYDVATNLLQDGGIKSKIIKQYLPIMNKLINKYLTQMDFFVLFELDGNFNESIKSRHRDIFTYNSFSEGQKARIDIALLLTWRKIARMKNSANTNLLILDEVFDGSLDSFGVDELTKLLQEDSDNDINNIFVISHQRDALSNKFDRVIEFKIKNNFSVAEIYE